MNAVIHADMEKNGAAETVSALVSQILIHAEGRDKAMDADHQDIVNMVADKLETLNNLVEFYWYAREKTGFNKDSINGLCLILCDCIAQLREVDK